MNGKRIGVMGLGLVLAMGFAARVVGGTLDSPAAPSNAASAMYTLEDIYQYLNVGATGAVSAFTEPSVGPTGTMHNLNAIWGVATNRAPVARTAQTSAYDTNTVKRDDGGLRKGVAFPNPRFSVVGAPGTPETNQIRDNLTGLIWARNMNIASNSTIAPNGRPSWLNAFNVITNGTGPVNGALYGGTNDWRLPNWKELYSLVDQRWNQPALCNTAGTAQWTEGNPFSSGGNIWGSSANGWSPWWTSSGFYYPDQGSPNARVISVVNGLLDNRAKTSGYFVWPVRGRY